MSEKRNIRDHKRRLLAAKYELRRKLYFIKPFFCKDPDLPSDMRDKLRYKLSKLPRLCTSKKPMYFHGSPSFRI